jgi:hypothetical protein
VAACLMPLWLWKFVLNKREVSGVVVAACVPTRTVFA